MNKDLLYDFGKLLKKHDPDDIRDLVNILKNKEQLGELVNALESIEAASQALRKEGRTKKSNKNSSPASSFRELSNAILDKPNANKAREDNSE